MTKITKAPGCSTTIIGAGILLATAAWAGAQGLPGWSQQKKIFMNTTATGADVAAEVKGYPVAVQLTAANFDFASAKADGADIRFTNASGAELPFEIELWDAAGKKAALWVKTDVKGNDKAQYIVLNWGNPAAAAAGDGKKVFAKEEGWSSAWHLSETGAAAADNYKDASGNAAHGKGINITEGATGEGRVGKAVNLDVAKKQYIRIEGSNSNPIYQLNTNATYSIWSNAKSHKIAYQGIFTKGETGFRIHYYGLPEWPDNTDPNTKIQENITEPCLDPGDRCPLKGGNDQAWKGTDVMPGKWFHLVLVVDNKKQIYYINGALEVQDGGGSVTSGTEPMAIGNNADRARYFDGLLDEARVLSVAKSADWVKLDYESQREGGKFLEFDEGGTGIGSLRSGLAAAEAGQVIRRFDIQGRLIGSILSTGNARNDRIELERSSKPGLHFDRVLDARGAILGTHRVLVP